MGIHLERSKKRSRKTRYCIMSGKKRLEIVPCSGSDRFGKMEDLEMVKKIPPSERNILQDFIYIRRKKYIARLRGSVIGVCVWRI